MEVIEISQKIEHHISLLAKARQELGERGKNRAYAIAEYEKVVGMTLLKLKNNAIQEHEGFPVTGLPTTILEKVARSICWKEKLSLEQNETEYKNAVVCMRALEAELSAYQTINRYLSHE